MNSERRSYSEVHVDDSPGTSAHARDMRREVENPVFRIAVCGDFSGRDGAFSRPPAAAQRVDRDDFDDVLASFAPSIHVTLGSGVTADVQIRELDDFHPDQLYQRVAQFATTRALRAELADPSTFSRAAAGLASPRAETPSGNGPKAPVKKPTLTSSGSLLDQMIGEPSGGEAAEGAPVGSSRNELYDYIQQSLAPLLVARADPRQADVLAQLDRTVEATMRALMHSPSFQALESLWRGVFELVRHVETDARLQISLVDVTRGELWADLAEHDTAARTSLYARLNALAPPAEGGWAFLVAHMSIHATMEDVGLLERLAHVGAALDAPWLAEAPPELALGPLDDETANAWTTFRAAPVARSLGLAMPRVLLRLPYGSDAEKTEGFAFEELESPDAHNSYLWGNPALCCARLLAQGFTERGSGLAPARSAQLDGLPLHITRHAGEVRAKPCAEIVMGENDAMALMDAGFIPMLSFRDQDIVRVPRIQSVAEPAAPLSGRMAR